MAQKSINQQNEKRTERQTYIRTHTIQFAYSVCSHTIIDKYLFSI